MVSQFRSTWVTSSIRALQTRGLLDQYSSVLAPEHRDAILYCVPGSWIPASLVVTHYEACEKLELSTTTLLEIGGDVTRRVHGPALALGRNVASAGGVTPWTILGRLDKLWTRATVGGAVGVAKLGPKQARVEVVGFPLAHLRYNRVGTRGIVHGVVQLFCTSAFVHEVTPLCTKTTLGFRVQWV